MAHLDVHHYVRQIPQPAGSVKCWAACVAMVLGRHGGGADSVVDDVVSQARQRGVPLYPTNALREDGAARLASAFGLNLWLRPVSQPTVMPDTFAMALQNRAAIILGERLVVDAGQHLFHAVVLDGVLGDSEGLLHCMLHGIDPLTRSGGGTFNRSVAGFQNYLRPHSVIYRA